MKRDVPHFRIGLLLTEAGILLPRQLDDAIQQGEQEGVPFLRVLVSTGYLKQHELQAVIRAQSLIWSGLLDVERAIKALSIVHAHNVSIDQGLADLGWQRPPGSLADTMGGSVILKIDQTTSVAERPSNGGGVRFCQYCGTALDPGSTMCPFCTGENGRLPSTRLHIEPAWQKQVAPSDSSQLAAAATPRDPLMMAFFSGCVVAGLGQIFIGQAAKGFCVILLAVLLGFITSGISSLIVFPLAALDVYLLADKLKNGKTIGTWEFF